MSDDLLSCIGAIGVEVDWAQAESTGLPAPAERETAERLAERVSVDLQSLLPGVEGLGLCLAGAVYELPQLLRPGFPAYEALNQLYERALQGQGFQPGQFTIGAQKGRMPSVALEPERSDPASALIAVPFVLLGPHALAERQQQAMEEVFVTRGALPPPTAVELRRAFNLPLVHATYLTVHDLCAIARVQLENIGLLPLWELIESALFDDTERLIQTDQGNRLLLSGDTVRAELIDFDRWAREGGGKGLDVNEIEEAYATLVREQRQYSAMLRAHGVQLETVLAPGAGGTSGEDASRLRAAAPMTSDYAVVTDVGSSGELPTSIAAAVEHWRKDLGTVCMTVREPDGALSHCYPLSAEAVQTLRTDIEERLEGERLRRVEGLNIDAGERRLTV